MRAHKELTKDMEKAMRVFNSHMKERSTIATKLINKNESAIGRKKIPL